MLDASGFIYQRFIDNRSKTNKGFQEGQSGPLKLATDPSTGKKYIIKYAYQHNAANEYTACWLADKIGVPAPHAYLLYPDIRFNALYPVAIEFIEGFTTIDKTAVPESMKVDLMAQFALNTIIGIDDCIQLNAANGHIYSYDFSEAFHVSDNLLLKMVLMDEDLGIDAINQRLASFYRYLSRVDFDVPGLAREFNLDPEHQKTVMIATAKKVLDITEDEIRMMSEELCEIYPADYSVYYEECIHIIQKRVKALT